MLIGKGPGTGQTTQNAAKRKFGHLITSISTKRYNSSGFLDFLKGLLADQKKLQGMPPGSKGRKLFVICDNHRMHKTKLVTDWVAAHEDEIELCFLSPYNPQLNPQEMMNQTLKNDI